MKKITIVIAILISTIGASAAMKVTSTAVKNNATMTENQVFNGMGCTGQNVSPDLKWTGAPKGTKAFAITAYDPDAPTGSGWWHWVIFNIPPEQTSLEAGASGKSLPSGAIESRTDFGKPGYGGPCPPPGKPHRYIFKVYALKDKISLDEDASPAMVGFYINQMKLGEAQILGKYAKKK
jgi:Raf kinase inhibitor-like YbhB/YbcL family protein